MCKRESQSTYNECNLSNVSIALYNNNSYNNDVQNDVSQCKITSIDKNDVIEVINLDNDCDKIVNNDCVISIHENCE